jgi:hypothetical protein
MEEVDTGPGHEAEGDAEDRGRVGGPAPPRGYESLTRGRRGKSLCCPAFQAGDSTSSTAPPSDGEAGRATTSRLIPGSKRVRRLDPPRHLTLGTLCMPSYSPRKQSEKAASTKLRGKRRRANFHRRHSLPSPATSLLSRAAAEKSECRLASGRAP